MLILLYLVSLFCVSTSASGIIAETEQVSNPAGLNELNVRLVVNSYFSQRLAYLKGENNEIAIANLPMVNDEAKHKAHLEANTIVTSYHDISSAWVTNTQYHWHACMHCGLAHTNKGAHVMVWNEA